MAVYLWLERKFDFLTFTGFDQRIYENVCSFFLQFGVFLLFSLFIRFFIGRIDAAKTLKEE